MLTLTPQYNCDQLANADFSQVTDAPATILSATLATATTSTGTSYPYCDVTGIVYPQVQFELQLPTQTYAQRYLQEGCGGYCGHTGVGQPAASGQAGINECVPLNNGQFALGQDNEGHVGGGSTETWAINDPMLKLDFGYLSEHVFAIAAKAIIASFYGKAPAYSYYDGCSDGGREALMEAQRFPTDFNGIIAGAPAFNQAALNAMEEPYESTADETSTGAPILTAADTPLLHTFIIKQCADPALHDGTIQDPRNCNPDWSLIACSASVTSNCLTADKIAAARRLYAGAVTSSGEHLYTGGEPYGAEGAWPGIAIPATTGAGAEVTTFFHNIGIGYLRWVGLWTDALSLNLDNNFSFSESTFEQYVSHHNSANLSSIVDATDPNLTAFYQAGGKLIQWHGWADQFIPPQGSVSYRQAVIDTMGASTVGKFYRLYMFPGVYHCGGGYGPNVFDLLTPIVNWVETGTAPSYVVAAAVSGGTGAAGTGASSGTVQYTRPVYPYPEEVKYSGSGNVNDAASYVGYTPATLLNDDFQWAGFPFRSGYEQWCGLTHDSKALVCTRERRIP
jgi:feruloyl esterase